MKIDRSNYEIWFIDWLDGNLDSHQAAQINLFLNENPDLKEEFNELSLATVEPLNRPFSQKEKMKKSSSDLTPEQFDYLSVAYLEKDLLNEQKSELLEIIARDNEKKKTFDLIQKAKVVPPQASFKYKKRLIRRTIKQKIIRLSVIGLSTAAAVTLIITYFLSSSGSISSDVKNLAAVNNIGTATNTTDLQNKSEVFSENSGDEKSEQRITKMPASETRNRKIAKVNTESTQILTADSLAVRSIKAETDIQRINFNAQINLKKEIRTEKLIATDIFIPITEEESVRSNLGKYLAKTFREKILREKTAPDAPIKGYEIAEAGVTGLNKIFGWEMALDRKTDDTGQLKSVYFRSRRLKFTAPVKKSEPLP
jgi:hypothetical protein